MNDHPTALIADDEPLLREALRRQLAIVWPELEIVAEARNGREAVRLFDERRPDVCFLDVHMPGLSGIDAAIASELGIDPTIPKRGALLHDIGKAVTHEVEGSHAIIGAEIARRMKEAPEVVHCIETHHGEVEQRTIDAVIAQIADGISGGRPGARRERLETYIKRLERLEEICTSYPGVEKVYAMQAGREVRVMVKPDDIDDLSAQVMARDIAKQVEEELQYPGQIKITVVRETRSIEFAK